MQLVSEILISKVIQFKWGGPHLYNVHWLLNLLHKFAHMTTTAKISDNDEDLNMKFYF